MDTLDKVLTQVLSDQDVSVISVDSVEDRYIVLTKLFANSKRVKMFSKNLSLFYQENIDSIEKQNSFFNTGTSFVNTCSALLINTDATLEIVAEDIPNDFIDHIHSKIASSFQNRIYEKGVVVKKMPAEISKVANLGHFTICEDLNAICIDQGNNNNQLLVINDNSFVSKALKVFEAFFTLSEDVDIESNTKD